MVLGWRRAFCTSIPRDPDTTAVKEKLEQSNTNPNPRVGSKFSFFSNPSTPRLQSQPVSSTSLRCRTTSTATIPSQSAPESPRLQCKIKNSPRFFNRSTPTSPRSPSTFSLLKSSLRLSRTRCGICLQSVKTGQGTAIFTAECSHSFHFPCIAEQVKNQGGLVCSVCGSHWKELPVLAIDSNKKPQIDEKKREVSQSQNVDLKAKSDQKYNGRSNLKVYNDDEPLMSPTSRAQFYPIPESENEDDDDVNENSVEEFKGFFVNANTSPVFEVQSNSRNVEVRLSPEAAVVSVGRSYETYAIVLKVRAPPSPAKKTHRAPIDLVTVLDVSRGMTSEKLQLMKRAMRFVVSSLSSADRISIVAFSGSSKRLLPLRRMTSTGRSSARRLIDALVACQGTSSVTDALKKAAKVLEDRRERNPIASMILLSDGHDGLISNTKSSNHTRHSPAVIATRFSHLEIPLYSIGLTQTGPSSDEAYTKCIGGLLNGVVQDLRLQLGFVSGSAPAEIAAVYSFTGRPNILGSGSIRLGDLCIEEEREVLIEMKVPSSGIGAHHVLSVRCCYKDSSTQQPIHTKEQALLVPRPHTVRSSTQTIERLRSLFVATRAVAESRRLIERNDLTGAHHMLSSARALLMQSRSASADEFIRGLEAELAELHWRRQNQIQQIQRRRTNNGTEREVGCVSDEKIEPLTPTSAWRAAERLAKVAIMRKSMNRVSDLHGFENARF